MYGLFRVEWELDDPTLAAYTDRLQEAVSAVAGRPMKHMGNLRRNLLSPGASIRPHSDGRLTDEDFLVITVVEGPEEGGEIVLRIAPNEGVFLVALAKTNHEVLQVVSGERVSITAVLTPDD
jgi:hypothetical protein